MLHEATQNDEALFNRLCPPSYYDVDLDLTTGRVIGLA
jgi:hypothetical protein